MVANEEFDYFDNLFDEITEYQNVNEASRIGAWKRINKNDEFPIFMYTKWV